METIWDWVTLTVFAGLVTLMLQRSTMPDPSDRIIQYAPPAVGCGVANYLGNEQMSWMAGVILLASVVYIFVVLRPFSPNK